MNKIGNAKKILQEEEIKDINFFEEDLTEMSNQLVDGEKLYNEIHDVFNGLTGAGGRYANTKSPRDIAEVAKSLVSARTLCNDIAYKRHQIRKNISDIVRKQTESEETEGDFAIKEAARTILQEVHKLGQTKQYLNTSPVQIEDGSIKKLENRMDRLIKDGSIAIHTNDRLIGVNNNIDFRYDKRSKKFIALDDRTGKPIKNFPEDRLPDNRISQAVHGEVITESGEVYKVLGEN